MRCNSGMDPITHLVITGQKSDVPNKNFNICGIIAFGRNGDFSVQHD